MLVRPLFSVAADALRHAIVSCSSQIVSSLEEEYGVAHKKRSEEEYGVAHKKRLEEERRERL
jgi:hypothetical protein